MTATLRSINGNSFTQPGEPVANIVEMLEEALREAKSGNMCAVAIAYVLKPDASEPITAIDFTCQTEVGSAMIAAVMKLFYRFNKSWFGDQ